MNIAVTLPADAPVLGAEPLDLMLSPLRPDLGTVTALYKDYGTRATSPS
jgi:hypothetical protein